MSNQGPSTNRERETLLLLREALPEYEINPHMRLANVVKGKLAYIGAMGQYELDFVVQDPSTGKVICAIELDDSTHDTEDGRRRDANKNRWMEQARINLIRIRMPKEALTIRERIFRPIDFNVPDEVIYSFEKKPTFKAGEKHMQGTVLVIVAVVLAVWGFVSVVNGVTSNLGNKAVALQQQILQQNTVRQAEANLQRQRETEQAGARHKVDAQPPHYERVLIKGKPVRECSTGNVINDTSVECMKDHYEMVWVAGNQ